jgi:hypothetical protein
MKMILDKPTLPKFEPGFENQQPSQNWDTLTVARLIRENSNPDTSPAFLYLGRIEATLLRDHLANAFGGASVVTLHEMYYMGLKVVTVDADSYIQTGGSKIIRNSYLPSTEMLNAS